MRSVKPFLGFLPWFLFSFFFSGIYYFYGREMGVYGLTFIIGGMVPLVLFLVTLARAMQKLKIARTGIPGTARILELETTGMMINYKPQVRFRLLVTVPGKVAYEVDHSQAVGYLDLKTLAVGLELKVIVDNDHPNHLLLLRPGADML